MTAGKQPDSDSSCWAGTRVVPGEHGNVQLAISESYTGVSINLPLHVWRGAGDGPTVFVTAAVHGDEINGTGAIRQIILDQPFTLTRGTLVLVPVINILGFERHSRYLPDRRDLNRCFPGRANGTVASRLAHVVFNKIVKRCDFGIDLHTAAVRRTNYPNVRGDMTNAQVLRIAKAFGCELMVHSRGPNGSLRRAACEANCPTIILEAGEVWKVQPSVVQCAVAGIRNVLIELGMVEGDKTVPAYQILVNQSRWVRAQAGGFLRFHVAPGDAVSINQPLASNTGLLGQDQGVITSPYDGVVLGMTTLPSVAPGDPVIHIAIPSQRGMSRIEKVWDDVAGDSLTGRVREDLSRNITVVDADDQGVADA